MTDLSGKFAILKSHRLFDLLVSMYIEVDAMNMAFDLVNGKTIPLLAGATMQFKSRLFQKIIQVPFGAFCPAAVKNLECKAFDITFADWVLKDQYRSAKITMRETPVSGLWSINYNIVGQTFLVFYERHARWLEQTYTGDVKKWPMLFMFATVVRNAFVHHEGALNFRNPNFPAVTWHTLTYSPADNGKRITGEGKDLSPADFIILMFEMSDELDRLGCPHPL